MNSITRRKRKQSWYHNPLFLFVLLILLVVFSRSVYFSFIKKNKAHQEYVQYEQRHTELEQKREQLNIDIEMLKSDRGREEEYRERYNAVREGEKVIRIIEEESSY